MNFWDDMRAVASACFLAKGWQMAGINLNANCYETYPSSTPSTRKPMSNEIQNTVPSDVLPDQTQMAPAAYEVKVVDGDVHVYIKSDHDVAAIMKLSPNAALYFGNDVTRASEEARKYVAPGPTGSQGPTGSK